MNVAELLSDRRICICAGPGGVGKTTTSAAVALGMAAQGLKVAVVTIDPAKRLANALGLEQLSNEPRRIEASRLSDHGVEVRGELWAMMLDPKRTFDELIDRAAPSEQRAQEIKSNRIYAQLSSAIAGSQEFTAVAKLYELSEENDFDLIVLDTPPSRSALDFFDAPVRLTSFLEGRALQMFLKPTGFGMRLFSFGAGTLLTAIKRVTGIDLIGDLTGFFALLGDMTETFSVRARRVDALLKEPTTAFLVVTSAQTAQVDEAIKLHDTLRKNGMTFTGTILNRFSPPLPEVASQALIAELEPALGGRLAAEVAANYADYEIPAERDSLSVERVRAATTNAPVLTVPHFDDDIHDVEGLVRVYGHLFGA